MNFVLQPRLFTSGRQFQLLRLWGAAVDRRHRIEIREDAEPSWRAWRARLDPATAEELDGALDWSVIENAERPSGLSLVVDQRATSAWTRLELTLEDAVSLAYRPFRIFVENSASDGLFFRAILTEEERAWLDNLVEREWLLLVTAGGVTEMEKWVAWARGSPSRLLRVAALFDGDAVEPPDANPESGPAFRARLHPHSRKALEACEAAQFGDESAFPHHVTRRRSIENYLPISALERRTRSMDGASRVKYDRRVRALATFAQRHQFNMKDGHSGDRKRNPGVTWLPAERNTHLEEGFGVDIAKYFAGVGSDDIDADGGFDEFRGFIDALRRRIM